MTASQHRRAAIGFAGVALLGLPLLAAITIGRAQEGVYYPGTGDDWERRQPAQVGMDGQLLETAIAFAKASESEVPRNLEAAHNLGARQEPLADPIGPFKPRGDMTGIIIRHGYLVAEWGEPTRVDMTFSVTKSFLSTTVGLAWDRGLIRDLDDPVREYVPTDHFDSDHNRKITWNHLLRQTSDWEGTLWEKPDWADRPPRDVPLSEHRSRARHEPGSVYNYNDVRVNVLALAALHVWRRPLPQVLREDVMDPIGASNTWRWHGYDNSWILIDGLKVQSVSGGGHWGGGMWISARDQARFGYFTLRLGRWKDRQLLSEEWFRLARTPTPAEPGYGFMNFFLNTGQRRLPSAPESAWVHLGSGTNMVYCDPENDLVVVARWIGRHAMDGFIRRVLAAVNDRAAEDGH